MRPALVNKLYKLCRGTAVELGLILAGMGSQAAQGQEAFWPPPRPGRPLVMEVTPGQGTELLVIAKKPATGKAPLSMGLWQLNGATLVPLDSIALPARATRWRWVICPAGQGIVGLPRRVGHPQTPMYYIAPGTGRLDSVILPWPVEAMPAMALEEDLPFKGARVGDRYVTYHLAYGVCTDSTLEIGLAPEGFIVVPAVAGLTIDPSPYPGQGGRILAFSLPLSPMPASRDRPTARSADQAPLSDRGRLFGSMPGGPPYHWFSLDSPPETPTGEDSRAGTPNTPTQRKCDICGSPTCPQAHIPKPPISRLGGAARAPGTDRTVDLRPEPPVPGQEPKLRAPTPIIGRLSNAQDPDLLLIPPNLGGMQPTLSLADGSLVFGHAYRWYRYRPLESHAVEVRLVPGEPSREARSTPLLAPVTGEFAILSVAPGGVPERSGELAWLRYRISPVLTQGPRAHIKAQQTRPDHPLRINGIMTGQGRAMANQADQWMTLCGAERPATDDRWLRFRPVCLTPTGAWVAFDPKTGELTLISP